MRPSSLSALVLVAGLVLTGSLTWASATIHQHNEDRLLTLELKQAASVVSAAIPSIQIPLTSAAELAAGTNGNPQQFRSYVTPYVGGRQPFASISLWRVKGGAPVLLAVVGTSPELAATPSAAASSLAQARPSTPLAVVNLLHRSRRPSGTPPSPSSPPRRGSSMPRGSCPGTGN